MVGMGRLENLARDVIARRRRSAPIRALHRISSFVESAYQNHGSEFALNGERSLLRRLCRANFHVAFDVGANFGHWTLEALTVWPDCYVHAFEVAPETFQRLQDRVRAFQHGGRAIVNLCGASDDRRSQKMYYFP